MGTRELALAEEESCRQKALQKVDTFLKSLPPGLDNRQRWDRLTEHFEKCASWTHAFSENFDPEKFHERGHDYSPEQHLALLMKGNVEGVEILDTLCHVMQKNPLSRVNGTSETFRKCMDIKTAEAIRLEANKCVFRTGGLPQETSPKIQDLMTKLATLGCQLLFACMALPDILTA